MKIAKTRFDYLFFIYVPFALIGILLNFFFQDGIIAVLKIFMPFTLLITLFTIVAPFSKQKPLAHGPVLTTRNNHSITKLLLLQAGVTLTFMGFTQGICSFILNNKTNFTQVTLLQQTLDFYQGGLWPWPFILLVSAALAYAGCTQQQPALLKNAVQPVIKQHADGIIGVGIEIFLKQGLLYSALLTISICCLLIAHIISQLLHLPSLFSFAPHTSIIGILLICLLAQNKFTSKLVRALWQKSYADQKLILIVSSTIIILLIGFNFLLQLISNYLFPNGINLPMPAFNNYYNINLWLLLSFCWWIGVMPLLTRTIATIMREYSLRMMLTLGMLLPLALYLLWQTSQYYYPHALPALASLINFWPITFVLGIGTLLVTTSLFHNPNTCNITSDASTCNPKERSSVSFLRTLWQLCIYLLAAFLLTNLNFLTYLAAALSAPIFATLFSAILGCIIIAVKNKWSSQKTTK